MFQESVRAIIDDRLKEISEKSKRFSAGVVSLAPLDVAGFQPVEVARKLTLPRKFPIPREAAPTGSARIDYGPTDPSVADNYDLFFNTTTNKLKIYFDSAWHIMAVLDVNNNLAISGRYLTE